MPRTERDLLGERTLPDEALYGINTLRAVENFPLGNGKTDPELLKGIITVKKAAALAYESIGIRPEIYHAAAESCDELLEHWKQYQNHFPIDPLQGGAGTSTNMNVNEVIANLTLIRLGKKRGEYDVVHPIGDINRGQSTNDVYPTGLRIAAIRMLRRLSDSCAALQETLQKKENELDGIKKLGRTELMDAVPIRMGEEFGAYAQAVARDRWRLYKVEERLRQVNIGGTAVGRSDTASRAYRFKVIEILRELTGIGLSSAEYPMDLTQNQDVFVEVSGLLKAMAVNLMKISGDLRLMNMGPHGGLSEIHLKPLQQGSTIMPGKVNPVVPESVIQCAIRVMANDSAISVAAAHGEFELNAFLPLIADSLLGSFRLLERSAGMLREAVASLEADRESCRRHLEASVSFAAEYLPILGYDTVSRIVSDFPPDEALARCRALAEEMKKQ